MEESAQFLSEVFKELNHKGQDFHDFLFNIQNEEIIYKFYYRHFNYIELFFLKGETVN